MAYQDMSDIYRDPSYRGRAEMCIREQAYIFVNDTRMDIKTLAQSIIAGNYTDIDAVMAGVASGPNGPEAATDDGALLSAVQAIWPTVAAARYPELTGNDVPPAYRMYVDRKVAESLSSQKGTAE